MLHEIDRMIIAKILQLNSKDIKKLSLKGIDKLIEREQKTLKNLRRRVGVKLNELNSLAEYNKELKRILTEEVQVKNTHFKVDKQHEIMAGKGYSISYTISKEVTANDLHKVKKTINLNGTILPLKSWYVVRTENGMIRGGIRRQSFELNAETVQEEINEVMDGEIGDSEQSANEVNLANFKANNKIVITARYY